MRKLQVEEAKMRACRDFGFRVREEPVDMFVAHTGHFWGIFETRDYCRARLGLATDLSYLAHEYEVKPLLEKMLDHRLELLRLIASDDLGLRYTVPFDLLNVNRDADCYTFIEHWVKKANGSPKGQDVDRLKDVFEGAEYEKYSSLAFLAAMSQIKLRNIAQYESETKQANKFAGTSSGKKIGPDALEHVQHHLLTTADGLKLTAEVIEEQERHLNRYFRIMNENIPTFLKAIVNPGPLMSMSPPDSWGTCTRIPGAHARIERLVGKKPTYDCSMD
ncbi:hypothetical protein SARC_11857 [Sphaeroforma arctica JP610]|uniref:Uncharacterized protein n=1 Tax=Sphaeroforma arctica JP610 TaxID=667725 RepID=A0A0L0FHX9_9EUKA|nr:hypothetical protein SARC_11857 [Sphaeroforma arctica JP610]KNC75623.1 hypothetical protein SARC_11857 [Sphaeroforma arctica JP610]|eukprot:XP_014149525.1 hypothetical protein SARC_11857 [Sphaeroforma arctica JP610]